MLIKQEENNGQGLFYAEQNGERLAEMTYYYTEDGEMVIDHTQVNEALQGKKIGLQLVEHGVEFARSNKLKIVPVCRYVKSVFEKNHQYDDVWK